MFSPCVGRLQDGSSGKIIGITEERLLELQEDLKRNGTISLDDFMRIVFNEVRNEEEAATELFFARTPRFIRILYEPEAENLHQPQICGYFSWL